MAPVAPTPVDRSKLDMTANQFTLIGGPLLAREVRGDRAVAETQTGLKRHARTALNPMIRDLS